MRAVLTARDIPELKRKAPTRAHAMLAIDRVVFAGQPVAAVAADELAIAEEACDLIDVQYEVLPAAVDPLKSMQPGAPPVADAGTEADTSEALAHSGVAVAKTEAAPTKAVNVSQQAKLGRGDVAKAFAESDVVIEKTYRVPMVHQGYLEPHAVLAQWDTNGQLTLWASTQGSFNTRSEVADVLQHRGEPDQGDPDGVRRRLRRQDPRAVRADHGHPGPRDRAAGALRDDPARGAGGRHAGAPGHHQAEDRRQARRHADGARGRDRSSSRARTRAPCSR